MKITKSCLGKRVLYKQINTGYLNEGVVEEISPSGEHFKTNGLWKKMDDFELVEILNESTGKKQILHG